MAKQKLENRQYKDIDLDFLIHPKKRDIIKKTDKNAIRQSLKNLVLFQPHDKMFQPEISGEVMNLLFEPMSPVVASVIKTSITRIINNCEPRIKLEGIDVDGNEDNNSYEIRIVFSFINENEPIEIDFLLERVK